MLVNPLFRYHWGVPKESLSEAVAANVTKLLREERKKRGLSMNVLAQRAGLSHSIISLVERDLRSPSLDTMLRLAEALDADLGKIITQAEEIVHEHRKQRKR
jgi:transcriptional regulator with XRE-family HTH domain